MPLCPFCEEEINTAKEMRLGVDKIIYICPKCRKVLGVGKSE